MSKFLKIIVNLFLICAILVAVAILVPPLCGITTTIVDTETMDTNLPMGSITYSKDIAVADLVQGNEILKESDAETYAYIIQSGDVTTGKYQVINAMDKSASPQEITLRNSVSKVILTVPYIGYVIVAMHSMEGIIIIALVVLFMIILFILSELWKKTPEDEDEEIEDDGTERKLTRKEEKAQRKAEKEQAKLDEKNARLEEKEAARAAKKKKKHGNEPDEDSEADETVGAVQAGMTESDRLTGESEEAAKNASFAGKAEEETAASVSKIMQEGTTELPVIGTHSIDTGLIRDAAAAGAAAAAAENAAEADKTEAEENAADVRTAAPAEASEAGSAAQAIGEKTAAAPEPEKKTAEAMKPEQKTDAEPKAEQKTAAEPKTEQRQEAWQQGNRNAQDTPARQYSAAQQDSAAQQNAPVQQDVPAQQPDRDAQIRQAFSETMKPEENEAHPEADSFEEDVVHAAGDRNAFVPVPRMTLDEILEQAAKDGAAEPQVRKDPVTGISVVDYSELL